MCCELYYRGSQINYQLRIKQESDREKKKKQGGRGQGERNRKRERRIVLFKPVYSDFCKVPLCLGDCTSEVSHMGP